MDNTLEEFDFDVPDVDFNISEQVQTNIEDTRSYIDKAFQDFNSLDGVFNKNIRKIVCEGNEEPSIASNELALVLNYKSKRGAGRRPILSGMDFIQIPLLTGPCRIPVSELTNFAKYLINLDRALSEEEDNG